MKDLSLIHRPIIAHRWLAGLVCDDLPSRIYSIYNVQNFFVLDAIIKAVVVNSKDLSYEAVWIVFYTCRKRRHYLKKQIVHDV